ncbi:MAG TPA: DUF6131 family protein [Candidatus Paceibacterota bacterium]|nr:DUF6131 family protein [Candidatus Paceibacterota bacterium]
MITLGIVLIVLSIFAHIGALQSLGVLLIVIGVVLALLGGVGRPIGGRRHYW